MTGGAAVGSGLPTSALAAVERSIALADENPGLGAFWVLDGEGAREAAALVDARPRGGAGSLMGTPVAVKDIFDVVGLPTTCGIVGEHPAASKDSQVVRSLRRAGAIPLGKTAMDPLACSTAGQAPGFPPCLNPVDSSLSPGGSSSGSAVAVAAGLVPVAIGTDTAGSIRVPAAYCGVVGFKPGRRAISRRGSVTVIPSFETVGVLAQSVSACARACVGMGARGISTVRPPDVVHAVQPVRVALLTDLLAASDADVAHACEGSLSRLDPDRFQITPTRLDWQGEGFGLALAWELARTWGDRVDSDPDRFTDLIKGTIEFGRQQGRGAYEEAMADIDRARSRLRRRFLPYSAMVSPTVPIPAPDREHEATRVSTRFTKIFSALGWPAISLPAGRDRSGRPIGIQVAGPPSRLDSVISVAAALEAAAPH